ncbi:MAG: glycosyltransferase [Gammaproteobacteria bacterium]|jgi:glycosyltransferase involved in cell wall biosynthesis|nr:glycosyltransferase [Gammaproteobacteria bacterium]
MIEETEPVLHVVNGEHYAGAERVQDLLALRLPSFGYRVDFACLKGGEFAACRQAVEARVHHCPMRFRMDPRAVSSLVRIVRAGKHRLIHTHTVRAVLIGGLAARIAGVPLVHHVHSPAVADTEAHMRNIRNAFVERMLCRRADGVVCVSSTLEGYVLERGAQPDRVWTVWNGVAECERLRPPRRAGEALVVGMMALFRPRKGIETLLEAIAMVCKRGADVRLRAVGAFEDEEYRAAVLRQAERLGLGDRVTWVGFVSDVKAEISRMHVMALPSLFGEGTPMVLLEAMAAGVPVVASRVEGIPGVMRDNIDGILVQPGSARDMARAILRMATAELDAAALGDSAQRRQRERFSDFSMASRVAEIYRDLLSFRYVSSRNRERAEFHLD